MSNSAYFGVILPFAITVLLTQEGGVRLQ